MRLPEPLNLLCALLLLLPLAAAVAPKWTRRIENQRQADLGDGTFLNTALAGDNLADNLNPVGQVYYAFSTTVCVPTSFSQEVGTGLGAQAGEKWLAEEVRQGGLTRFRRAAETPFNLILEARP